MNRQNPWTRRRGSRSREAELRELRDRVERLESEIQWLRRVVENHGEANDMAAVKSCPNCASGILVSRGDELRCLNCRYMRFL